MPIIVLLGILALILADAIWKVLKWIGDHRWLLVWGVVGLGALALLVMLTLTLYDKWRERQARIAKRQDELAAQTQALGWGRLEVADGARSAAEKQRRIEAVLERTERDINAIINERRS